MKQLIVLAAVLPILLVFFAQSQLDRLNDRHVFLAERAVAAFEAEAAAGGSAVDAAADSLRARLAEIFGAEASDVTVSLSATADGFATRYSVRVPMGRLMAGGGLFGLDSAANRGAFTAEGEVADLPARVASLVADAEARIADTADEHTE
ncbi:MAG: hypothetical protein LBR00_02255 [Clostridiales Family XIII bacterium]|jgi:hypothetical protein|nr:hypothetical protein [Clostridiales Family XIII bacterium]